LIKYLGSKRRLLPVLTELFERSGATSALDLFTGTTRVAQGFKRAGGTVTAVDTARYSEVFARTWIETDADELGADDRATLTAEIDRLNALPGDAGYVTDTFCTQARFFQPFNGERIDAIRQAIADDHAGTALEPILVTSLLLAADRVDSTTGVQMAYVKAWAPRSFKPLHLAVPDLLGGSGRAVRGDAMQVAGDLGSFDLAYLDPPYNQHPYGSNYFMLNLLCDYRRPQSFSAISGIPDNWQRSPFNLRRRAKGALFALIRSCQAKFILLSYNSEGFIPHDDFLAEISRHGRVTLLKIPYNTYRGSRNLRQRAIHVTEFLYLVEKQ